MADSMIELKEKKKVSSSDKVIAKVKEMIKSGILKPGDRLPAERKMAADLGFNRAQVKEALYKLEFYGIIKTLPQSGSIISSLDINTLDGLITDVLNLQDYDFYSLVETRFILEVNAAKFCAERRTEQDLDILEKAHDDYVRNYETPDRERYDFTFHRNIAEASHNPVIKAMLLILTPDIMAIYQRDRICSPSIAVIAEHALILDAIKKGDGELAAKFMSQHLEGVVSFAKEKLNKESQTN